MTNDNIDLTGRTLGSYKVVGKLGKGGMAVVYKAHEASLNRMVALKVLNPQLSRDEEFIKRFQREARAAAQLNHPNIVQIFSIGQELDLHFFAMEYVKGKSLATLKREKGKLTPKDALPLVKQTALALAQAHKAGLVHRDIKPSNIMIDESGQVKVADFGIAFVSREKTRLTQEGSIIGTPEYLSPEQCEGKAVDGRSDIYSLGVTLYELLTGKTPYEADTPVSMLVKIVQGKFMPIGQANPTLPLKVQALVERMMETDLSKRFRDTGELIAALDGISEESVRVHIPTRSEKGNNKLRALAFAAVIALLLGGAFAAKVLVLDPKKGPMDKQPELVQVELEETDLPVSALPDNNEAASSVVQEDLETRDNNAGTEMSQDLVPMEPATQPMDQSARRSNTRSIPKQPVKSVKKLLPPKNSVVISTLGGEGNTGFINAQIQAALKKGDFVLVDGPSVSGKELHRLARYHLVTTVENLASTTLNYYGSSSELYKVVVTMKVVNPATGRIGAGPLATTIEFTTINVEEKFREALKGLTRDIMDEMRNN